MEAAQTEQDLREQALQRLKKKRDFKGHVFANAYDVYGRKPISEDAIRREADRLRGSDPGSV